MRIDAHAHGAHAERNGNGKLIAPMRSAWHGVEALPSDHIKEHNRRGIFGALVLDPVEVTFDLKKDFGDFVLPCPQVVMDESSPEEIACIMERGACGIKFIAPLRPYGDERYLPLYDAVRSHNGLAVFHTGYLGHDLYDPGCVLERPKVMDITFMRPSELDRINRALPELKILMAHFGNPWWEEAWILLKSGNNIYSDFSGGTAYGKSMHMWKEMFAPNGKLNTKVVSKLCYASDVSMFWPGDFPYQQYLDFYDELYDTLDLPEEIRRKIDRENVLSLTARK